LLEAGGVVDDPGFECFGALETTGDADEDGGDVAGAEWGGVRTECVREFAGVVDQLTDDRQEACDAAWFGIGGLLRVGHERDKSIGRSPVSRKFFPIIIAIPG
jgi:hypothetical protein